MLRTLRKQARAIFAPFLVLDDYGTSQRCWTKAEALGWLPYLSDRSRIVNVLTGCEVAA